MNSDLALPPMPQQIADVTNDAINGLDEWTGNEDFQTLIPDETLASIDLNNLFPDDGTANFNPMPDFNSMPMFEPMPPQLRTQLPTPTSMEPDTVMGPSYDPRIGWYFRAIPSSGFATPVSAFPNISEGYTPLPSMPPSVVPSRSPTPLPHPAPPKSKSRRQYGPAAYLEEQAKKNIQASLGSTDLPAPSPTFPNKQSSASHPLRSSKNPQVIQTCVCSDKEANKIKRPKNAFILYRAARSKGIIESLGGRNDNQAVSKIAGESWRNERPEVIAKFKGLAAQEKARHEAMYPNYKYQPGQSSRNKFGSTSCTCGAYAVNLRALREREGLSSDDEEDDFVPSSRRKSQRAPPAPMMQTALPDLSTFGFSTPAQRAEASAYVENMKRKLDATAYTIGEDIEEPLAKRRSPRFAGQSVSYAEPAEDDIFCTPYFEPMKSRPFEMSPTLSQAGFAFDDSPARNTRSNSIKSRNASPQFDLGCFDASNTLITDAEWDVWFATNLEEASAAGAQPLRRSSRKVSR